MASIGVIIAFFAIVLGPFYSEPQYEWWRHTISELAAQNTRNAWVMQLGMLAAGLGVIIDFVRSRRRADIPFAAWGIFIVFTALFPHRPFVEGRAVSETLDFAHSVFAFLAGMSADLGFVVRFLVERNIRRKIIYAGFAVMYVVLPLMMTLFSGVEGLLQRIIFGSFFVWVLLDFPWKQVPGKGHENCQ